MNNTPTSTRSYKSIQLMDARKYFSLGLILSKIEPDKEKFNAMFKAAVAATAYKPARGKETPFPEPLVFIEAYFDRESGDAVTSWTLDDREESVCMLRAAFKLSQYMSDSINELAFTKVKIACPVCERPDVEVTLGFGVRWDSDDLDVVPDHDAVRMIELNIGCECECFNIFDFDLIEAMAKEEVRVKL